MGGQGRGGGGGSEWGVGDGDGGGCSSMVGERWGWWMKGLELDGVGRFDGGWRRLGVGQVGMVGDAVEEAVGGGRQIGEREWA